MAAFCHHLLIIVLLLHQLVGPPVLVHALNEHTTGPCQEVLLKLQQDDRVAREEAWHEGGEAAVGKDAGRLAEHNVGRHEDASQGTKGNVNVAGSIPASQIADCACQGLHFGVCDFNALGRGRGECEGVELS